MSFTFVPDTHMTMYRYDTAKVEIIGLKNQASSTTYVPVETIIINNKIYRGFNDKSLPFGGTMVEISLGILEENHFFPIDKISTYIFTENCRTDNVNFIYFDDDNERVSCVKMISEITVPSQLDPEYRSIADRQCSWFCVEIIKSIPAFISLFNKNDTCGVVKLYTKCLETASLNKKNSPDKRSIETLFHQNIKNYIKKYLGISYEFYKLVFNPSGEQDPVEYKDNLNNIYGNYYDVEKCKNGFEEISPQTLLKFFDRMHNDDAFAVNRMGESFVILKYNSHYVCFDSHSRTINVFESVDKVIDYVNNTKSYNLVTVMASDLKTVTSDAI
jgi:hypothetical protein